MFIGWPSELAKDIEKVIAEECHCPAVWNYGPDGTKRGPVEPHEVLAIKQRVNELLLGQVDLMNERCPTKPTGGVFEQIHGGTTVRGSSAQRVRTESRARYCPELVRGLFKTVERSVAGIKRERYYSW